VYKRQGWWEADLVLLHPTRIVPRKAIESGLRLTLELSKRLDVRYLITGATDPHNQSAREYAESVKSLTKQLRIEDNVTFLNDLLAIGPHQLTSLYSVADALFFPSQTEGFGLPILEAAAFRLPAFCPDREPLNLLPGAITFDPSLHFSELSEWLIRHTEAHEAIKGRKQLAKTYRWLAIYRNFLAPLLEQPQT
jgi:glycosyltransferase involved in cell wall biosynthesis